MKSTKGKESKHAPFHIMPHFKNSLKKSKISSWNSCNYCLSKVQTLGLACINKNLLFVCGNTRNRYFKKVGLDRRHPKHDSKNRLRQGDNMTEVLLQQSTNNKRKITNIKRCKTPDNIYMYKDNTIHLWTGEEVNGNIFEKEGLPSDYLYKKMN
jgi:hypothetical protein